MTFCLQENPELSSTHIENEIKLNNTETSSVNKKIVSKLKQRKHQQVPSMAPLSDSTNSSSNKTINKTKDVITTATTTSDTVVANNEQDENCQVQ